MAISRRLRRAGGALLAAVLAAGPVACSSGSGSSGRATFTVWDPYPQYTAGSAWVKLLSTCGSEAGVTVQRTAFDTTALTSKVLLAAQQGNAPDVLIVDNPVVSTLADAGVLTTTAQTHVDTSATLPNLLAAGKVNGKTYGIPIGSNTLALYYNKTVLRHAGVSTSAITNWASLTAALAKVKRAGDTGITFSAIGTEEGSFQFLPWFWGAGGNLTRLDSPQAVAALTLWTGWLNKGYAPNSVINNTQTTSWQEFSTGKYGFGENGTWQLGLAGKLPFPYGIISIPGQHGGTAPAPLGGEFITIPVQRDTSRYATSEKIVRCLSSANNSYTTDSALTYIAPTAKVQAEQAAKNPQLKIWIAAVHTARGRTADNLGTHYPVISQQMWTAVQAALSGSKTPASALQVAQSAASKKQ